MTLTDDQVAAGVAVKSPRHRGQPRTDDGDMWPWWVSDPPRLEGNPAPSWEWFDETADFATHGDRCAKFAHKVGHPLFGWQWETERKILATRPDGLWAHPDVCLIIPRQNGKTQLVVFRILYGLFFLGEKIVYTAQKWLTVEDVYDRIVAIIDARPSLAKRLDKSVKTGVTDGHSKAGNHGVIALKNGARLEMGPRTKAVGRGMTKVDLAIFDEGYDLKDTHRQDTAGARLASDNPQIIVISTAAVWSQHPNCHVLANLRWNGLRHDADLYAAEWRAPDGRKRDDPETWRLAMPSFGVTVRAREIASDFRTARTAAARAIVEADYLSWGEWPPPEEGDEPAIDIDRWDALMDKNPLLVGDVVLVVERSMDRRMWCIAAGQRTVEGRVHVEVGYYEAAHIGQVAAYLLGLRDLWNPAAIIVDDRSHAKPIVNFMLKLDVEMEVATTPWLAAATGGFVDAVEAGDVTHMGQIILHDAVDGAQVRRLPRGDFVWDDTDNTMAPLKAVTLAYDGVLRFAEERKPAAAPQGGGSYVDLDSPVSGTDVGADDVTAMSF